MKIQDSKGTILYIGGFELPDKNAAAQRVMTNAKAFRELGFRTVLIGVSKDIPAGVSLESTKTVYEGFDAYAVAYPATAMQWKGYLTSDKAYVELAEKIEDLRIIICYNFQSVALEKIRQYCSKKKIKCVADVTEWYSGAGRSLPVKVLKYADTFYRMRVVQKKMDGLIVISRYLENYYKHCRNVVYLPPLTDFHGSSIKRNEKLQEPLRLVYAGSPGLKDRIDLLIEAIGKVRRSVRLDVVGITKTEYLKLHPNHQTVLDAGGNIEFHGRLSHHETINFVKQADFSCFFRDNNRVTQAGFPTKFAESISLGIPVITNKSSNIEEYIYNNVNGILLEALTPRDIAETIDNVKMTMLVEEEIFDYRHHMVNFMELINNFEGTV